MQRLEELLLRSRSVQVTRHSAAHDAFFSLEHALLLRLSRQPHALRSSTTRAPACGVVELPRVLRACCLGDGCLWGYKRI